MEPTSMNFAGNAVTKGTVPAGPTQPALRNQSGRSRKRR